MLGVFGQMLASFAWQPLFSKDYLHFENIYKKLFQSFVFKQNFKVICGQKFLKLLNNIVRTFAKHVETKSKKIPITRTPFNSNKILFWSVSNFPFIQHSSSIHAISHY